MQHLDQPFNEFTQAAGALESMRAAASLDDFEQHWMEYLRRIERVWNKTVALFKDNPGWHGWAGKYINLRKRDSLLSYLSNARGADEHTVGKVVARQPSRLGIRAAEGDVLHIERMSIDQGRVFVKSHQDIAVDFTPGMITLLPVTNRGRVYPVPTTHLGRPIDPGDVVAVAEAGLAFYHEVVDKAVEFFTQ